MIRKAGIALLLACVFMVTAATGAFASCTKRQAASKKPALPVGFIALAPKKMTWKDAQAYCSRKGGKLPLINNAASLESSASVNVFEFFIDGFGKRGSLWPDDLPEGSYWTGTVVTEDPSEVRVVLEDHKKKVDGNNFYIISVHVVTGVTSQDVRRRVVCVP
jgi:hypothetical protein